MSQLNHERKHHFSGQNFYKNIHAKNSEQPMSKELHNQMGKVPFGSIAEICNPISVWFFLSFS